ncbi:MAG: type II toxin-antitoxin system HicB family antitoxin [Syntrophorhabdales bacterium]|jgi:predicted RNase H-like HicB family nuclease
MEPRVLSYRVVLRPEPEGGYTVLVPSLPGLVTFGDTIEEAKAMALDAIEAYLKSLEKHGEELKDDSDTWESLLTVRHA